MGSPRARYTPIAKRKRWKEDNAASMCVNLEMESSRARIITLFSARYRDNGNFFGWWIFVKRQGKGGGRHMALRRWLFMGGEGQRARSTVNTYNNRWYMGLNIVTRGYVLEKLFLVYYRYCFADCIVIRSESADCKSQYIFLFFFNLK